MTGISCRVSARGIETSTNSPFSINVFLPMAAIAEGAIGAAPFG